MIIATRSLTKITVADLQRLAAIARADREDLFRRNPALGELYADRLICVALCQGAALHYLNGKNGIKDFDVWTFFREHPKRPFPYRRNVSRDFGDPKFGTSKPNFIGRSVDLLGRSIPCKQGQGPIEAIQDYLMSSQNRSPRLLAKKAVIILEPEKLIGTVAWPVSALHSQDRLRR
jgi:hypothetical protein